MNVYDIWISKICLDSEHNYSDDDPWGSWSETWHNTFGKIAHKGDLENERWDLEQVNSELYFGHGEDVYVVWVEYSTGDSFGWGSHNRTDVISVHKTLGSAEDVQQNIIDHSKSENGIYTGKYTAKDGQVIDIYYGAWEGYFETLESVHIEHTIMSPRSITVTP